MNAALKMAPISERGRPLAPLIDHTLLKPDATRAQVEELCAQARFYSFASVCVNPGMIKLVVKELEGTSVKPCAVIGFPLGATTVESKSFETSNAVQNGAKEVDMVINISAVKAGDDEYLRSEIRSVVRCARKCIVKVILETCLLTEDEKTLVCSVARDAEAHFVKTSTGMAGGGATVDDVRLMRRVVGRDFGVKASGGIKTYNDVMTMITAGANRIGTSAGVAIVTL
jgi:deoxyribose-phosphate aldolase